MNTDILIIGGGLAGITAAWEIIKSSNLRVDLLQWGGGASPYIHGFCLPVGEGDSEDLFFEDTITSGYGQCRQALVRRLCRESLHLPDYFRELGLDIDREGAEPRLIQSLGSSVPRIAGIGNNTGPVMLTTLRKKLHASGRYREHRDFRALELLKKDDRVIGARCYHKEADSFRNFYAGLVILASGGFGKLFPESTNASDIGGDGCAMAYLAGGKLSDMEFIQFEPSAAIYPEALKGKSIITTMFYEGAVLRGGDGERFMLHHSQLGERVSKDTQAKCIAYEIRRGNGTPHGGVWFDATAVPQAMWEGVYKPYLNRYLSYGIDLRKEAVEIAPAAHTTCGGILIDEYCRTGIPGLLACGEVTGGLHGANRLGGNAGLETMVFGRIAGQTAVADHLPSSEGAEAAERNLPADVTALRSRLQGILRQSLGVIRTETELQAGLRQTDALLSHLGTYKNCYEKHRLYNDLLTSRMALMSALHRKESCGCHTREDSRKEAVPYRIIIENTRDGFALSQEPI